MGVRIDLEITIMENDGLNARQQGAQVPEFTPTLHELGEQLYRQIADTVSDGASMLSNGVSSLARAGESLMEAGLLPRVFFTSDQPQERQIGRQTQEAQTRLETAAREQISDPAARQRFLDDLRTFSARTDLPESEMRATYDTVTELLRSGNAEGGRNRDERVLAARGIIYNAAHPETLAQIGGTCGAASIERILYQNQPSVAAAMVSSVVRTGQFTGRDGRTIQVPSVNLTPQGPQLLVPPQHPPRTLGSAPASYASQVFLASMFNEIGQHLDPPRTYERNGEREEWVHRDGTRVDMMQGGTTGTNGDLSMTGGLPSALVVSGLRRITGRNYSLIQNPNFDIDRVPTAEQPIAGVSAEGLQRARSPQELQNILAQLQQRGELPAVVSISSDALLDLAFRRPGDAAPRDPAYTPDHFVTIHGYRPGPPAQVDIRNSWGEGHNRTITLDQLFQALGTRQPRRRDS